MLKDCTKLKYIDIGFNREDQEADKAFRSEIKFYTKMKSRAMQADANYSKIMRSCDPNQMFDKL